MMADADLSHLPRNAALGVQRILRNYAVMSTCAPLGTIGATEHRIDLDLGARPRRSQPHRAGPTQR